MAIQLKARGKMAEEARACAAVNLTFSKLVFRWGGGSGDLGVNIAWQKQFSEGVKSYETYLPDFI